MRDPAHTRSVGLLLAGALCWSLAGVLCKYVAWSGLAAAAGRGLIAALFLLAVSWRSLRFTWTPLQLGAAAAYAACTVLFTTADKMTTAANAILLQYTVPVWIALLGAWLLHEHSPRADWATIAAVLGGLALFVYDGLQMHNLPGILGNLLSVVVGLPAVWHAPPLPPGGWLALSALGTVQLGLAYFLHAKAIRHVTALEAVLIPVLKPILNPVWVMLTVGAKPSRYALIGGAIVLDAVTLRAIASIRAPRPAL